ncbi:hypothetical protein HYV91_01880 [Candidatus Wolfebacteria bacterium]|nr:hypothetical protein [Candidatus Wolfebacteria bacterium]
MPEARGLVEAGIVANGSSFSVMFIAEKDEFETSAPLLFFIINEVVEAGFVDDFLAASVIPSLPPD